MSYYCDNNWWMDCFDMQSQPEITDVRYCFICKEDVPMSQIDEEIYDDRGYVCKDCLREWCTVRANEVPEIIEGFIGENETEFYINWWFSHLQEKDRLDVIKDGYYIRKKREEELHGDLYKQLEREFCLEDDYFPEFVKQW